METKNKIDELVTEMVNTEMKGFTYNMIFF